jgi:hypothetical protein
VARRPGLLSLGVKLPKYHSLNCEHPREAMTSPALSPDQMIERAKDYLRAIEDRVSFDELSRFYTPDCVQEEFPNRLVPNGARRTLNDLRAAAERGSRAVESQRYEVLRTVAQDSTLALEVRWSAKLLVPFGSLTAGSTMTARFAMFLEFRGDRIARQHNYDCFDPF